MARTAAASNIDHTMKIGLGDAVVRLIWVEKRYNSGLQKDTELVAERELLRDALNEVVLDLNAGCSIGADLNQDGIPDTVQFFSLAATTGCCEIKRKDTSTRRRSSPVKRAAKAKAKTKAPRKAPTKKTRKSTRKKKEE